MSTTTAHKVTPAVAAALRMFGRGSTVFYVRGDDGRPWLASPYVAAVVSGDVAGWFDAEGGTGTYTVRGVRAGVARVSETAPAVAVFLASFVEGRARVALSRFEDADYSDDKAGGDVRSFVREDGRGVALGPVAAEWLTFVEGAELMQDAAGTRSCNAIVGAFRDGVLVGVAMPLYGSEVSGRQLRAEAPVCPLCGDQLDYAGQSHPCAETPHAAQGAPVEAVEDVPGGAGHDGGADASQVAPCNAERAAEDVIALDAAPDDGSSGPAPVSERAADYLARLICGAKRDYAAALIDWHRGAVECAPDDPGRDWVAGVQVKVARWQPMARELVAA